MAILEDEKFIKKINLTLKNDGVIAFVTDTVWGMGCLPNKEKAVDKIYEIKGRDRTKPLILMSDELNNLLPYIKPMDEFTAQLAKKYFPGALTIITEKSDETPDYITSGKNTVGIRVPDNQTFNYICKMLKGNVLATTSANLSGQPAAKTYEEALKFIGDYVDLVISDYNNNAKGIESTVVSYSGSELKVLRQGSLIL